MFLTADLHPNCSTVFALVKSERERVQAKLVKYKVNMLTQSQKKKLCLIVELLKRVDVLKSVDIHAASLSPGQLFAAMSFPSMSASLESHFLSNSPHLSDYSNS